MDHKRQKIFQIYGTGNRKVTLKIQSVVSVQNILETKLSVVLSEAFIFWMNTMGHGASDGGVFKNKTSRFRRFFLRGHSSLWAIGQAERGAPPNSLTHPRSTAPRLGSAPAGQRPAPTAAPSSARTGARKARIRTFSAHWSTIEDRLIFVSSSFPTKTLV